MTYRDTIAAAMTLLGEQDEFICVGYNVAFGKAAGTLNGVPPSKLIETPLSENLMAGMAIGLSLGGFVPLLWVERMDFLTNAMDAIVNHLAKLEEISEGLHRPACIIRCCVGNSKVPLFTGPTHVQNFSKAMRSMVGFPVIKLTTKEQIAPEYELAWHNARNGISTMLVEMKDLYASL